MNRTIYIAVLLTVLATSTLKAQFTIIGEVRPRAELRNGFKTLTDESKDPSFFTEQRSRLYLDYAMPEFKFRLALQDIRIWGETSQIFKEETGKAFISEAWGQYFVSPFFSVKAGRQIISYDNQRFFGGLEWAQQGRRHDAMLLIYENDSKLRMHLGLAYNQDDDVAEPGFIQSEGANFYNVGGNYKTLQYGWFNKSFDQSSLSLLAVNAGYQNADSTVAFKQTLGLTGYTKLGAFKFGGDFYYQLGEQSGMDVKALLVGFKATLATSITPITLGYEMVSGDDNPSDGINRAFSPDFGTNHLHNGLMDYFFVGPANGAVGVQDIYLKTKFKLGKRTVSVHVHEFLTGSEQQNGEGESLGKAMGTEIDLVYAVKLNDAVSWQVGYSQMFGTDTMEVLRGGDAGRMNYWAWTMLTFKPTLFKSE